MAELPFTPVVLLRELLDRKRAVDAGESNPPWPRNFRPGLEEDCLRYLADVIFDDVANDGEATSPFGVYCDAIEDERRRRQLSLHGPIQTVPVLRKFVARGVAAPGFCLAMIADFLTNVVQLGQLKLTLQYTPEDLWCEIFRERKARAKSRQKRALPATFAGATGV